MIQKTSIEGALQGISQIDGFIAGALVDYESGMCLGTIGGNSAFDIGLAAAGNTDVVRSKAKVMKSLGLSDRIEDILITLSNQYHLIRPLHSGSMFLYVSLRRQMANLAMARIQLSELEKAIA